MRQEGVVPFQLGETLDGTDADGNLINESWLGTVREFPAIPGSSQTNDKYKRSAKPVKVIALRNVSGGTLSPKTTVQLDTTSYPGTGTKDGLLHASDGASSTKGELAVIVDEFLPGTVADDDIFWGVIEGPVHVLTDSAYTGTSAVGNKLVAGANGGIDNIGTSTGVEGIQGYALESGVTGTGAELFIFAKNGFLS